MSTTNPPPGHDPVDALAPRQPGSPTPDEHDRGGGPPQSVIQRGYEADGYDAKSVISVPVLVIGFFVLAFTCVTILFSYFRHRPDDPLANPQAVEANSKSLNEQIAATPKRGRPEPLKIEDDGGGNPRATPRDHATGWPRATRPSSTRSKSGPARSTRRRSTRPSGSMAASSPACHRRRVDAVAQERREGPRGRDASDSVVRGAERRATPAADSCPACPPPRRTRRRAAP